MPTLIPTLMPTMFLALFVHTQTALDRLAGSLRDDRDDGQATTEYALVLLAAALVALLVVAWATAGGGSAKISRLFNKVLDTVIGRV